jgi:hypothetical protein
MLRYQWNAGPSLSRRCKKDRKIDIHYSKKERLLKQQQKLIF